MFEGVTNKQLLMLAILVNSKFMNLLAIVYTLTSIGVPGSLDKAIAFLSLGTAGIIAIIVMAMCERRS